MTGSSTTAPRPPFGRVLTAMITPFDRDGGLDLDKAQELANRLGWTTFRVKKEGEPVLPDEVVCPASEVGGKKSSCSRCLLCQGNRKGVNIVIDDHGPGSHPLRRKQQAARAERIQLGIPGRTP